MNKSKIVVIILLIIVLLIPGIGVKNAFINFRSYNKVRKDVMYFIKQEQENKN